MPQSEICNVRRRVETAKRASRPRPSSPAAEHRGEDRVSSIENRVSIHCNEFVEIVTDYLDGALAPGVVVGIDAHLDECPGCASVLEQFRETIRQAGRIRETDVALIDPAVRAVLMNAFATRAGAGA